LRDADQHHDPAEELDPSRFFRVLKEEEPSEEFWSGFWPAIRAGVREADLRSESILTRGRALLLGSSAGVMTAAAVLILAFFVAPHSRRPDRKGPDAPSTSAAVPRADEVGPPPVLEDLRSVSARVYTFHVGRAGDATEVILIVDEKIDL